MSKRVRVGKREKKKNKDSSQSKVEKKKRRTVALIEQGKAQSTMSGDLGRKT